MSKLTFEFDWADPLGAKGPELRATWAHLKILADGLPITRMLDERANTVRDGIYIPLYPLAEWFATHWWSINYEVPSPSRTADEAFLQRHSNLRFRDGYAIPRLLIQSTGTAVSIRWFRERLPRAGCEFLEEGQVTVTSGDFQAEVIRLIEATLERMDAAGVVGTLLQDEWKEISENGYDDDVRPFCVAAAQLGFDPYSIDDEMAGRIIGISETIPVSIRDEFMATARAERLASDAASVASALASVETGVSDLSNLQPAREALARLDTSNAPPWQEGYEAARGLRRAWQMNGERIASVEQFGSWLGADATRLRAAIFDLEPGAPFDAAVGSNAAGHPRFGLVRTARPESRLFEFSRALFELLHSADAGPALVTRAASSVQMRNRAFAAEFLAPAETLRELVRGSVVWPEQIDELSDQFGVSSFVIRHQLENHRIATLSADAG